MAGGDEPFTPLTGDDLGIANLHTIGWQLPRSTLVAEAQPRLMAAMLAAGPGVVVYLDHETRVLGPLTGLSEDARTRGLVARWRHRGAIDRLVLAAAAGSAGAEQLSHWIVEGSAPDQVPSGTVAASWADVESGKLARAGGELTLDGRRVAVLDFGCTDRATPEGALARELWAEREAELTRCGVRGLAQQPYGFHPSACDDATGFHLRRLRSAEPSLPWGRDTDRLARETIAWLRKPAAVGAHTGVNRFLQAVWTDRPDLRQVYPDLSGTDGLGLIDWAWRYGTRLHGLPPELLPLPIAPRDRQAQPSLVTTTTPVMASANGHGATLAGSPCRPHGVNVVGALRSVSGLGEFARRIIAALDAADVAVAAVQIEGLPAPYHPSLDRTIVTAASAPYDTNLICVNGDCWQVIVEELGHEFFEGRRSIGIWFWEVADGLPDNWPLAARWLDEVWVMSEFVAEALRERLSVPVVVVPAPTPGSDRNRGPLPFVRSRYAIPDRDFLFCFMFDFLSTAARKNPLGTIDAFRRAFGPDAGATLLLKSINGFDVGGIADRVRLEASRHPKIVFVDEVVSVAERDAFVGGCDCYVSLHRSEGLGLSVAEAMALGKPVIATRYGGTLEFTTDQNAYLVDYVTVGIDDGEGVYPVGATWADPSIAQASKLMRHVFEHRDEAAARGLRAAADMAARHSDASIGSILATELARVGRRSRRQLGTAI